MGEGYLSERREGLHFGLTNWVFQTSAVWKNIAIAAKGKPFASVGCDEHKQGWAAIGELEKWSLVLVTAYRKTVISECLYEKSNEGKCLLTVETTEFQLPENFAQFTQLAGIAD